ncbi:ABC transporter substrate-binding protein [Planococcus salinarum]|uniref:ABC transporter substrate-binding protein n=1 Tax=Planococcus salinarum TaxID=622695 RepID=A0ABX3CUI3_9BACL|nr:transporter substrate-binding domain-containing protein [Planococcus salinarum]OHX49139.1 ABC transporter substrate-binding protein [Planococcus salinarum]TAA73499.1 transporter substrate-binding domain-containing protein [Planococcus salinarum]
MNKKLPFLGIVLSAGMIIAACGDEDTSNGSEGSDSEGAGSDLDLVEPGEFTTASSGLYKPFNFTEGGDLTGFDIDISNALAEEMGLEPNPITTPWETIIQGLTTNRFDAIIGSMAITEEREEQVSFSDPYYYSGGVIFVREGNTEITSEEDLEGAKIGVVGQSTYDTAAQQYTDDIQYYNSDVVALQDLAIEGRLDAVITADVVGFEAQNAGLEIEMVGDPLWIEQAAVAVNKEDEALLEAVNEALDAIIENGTYDEISEKWFGRNLLDVDLEGVEILK